MKSPQHIRSLRVGNAAVELLESNHHEFIGLGGVPIGGVPMRSRARPITVQLDTPDGILYTRLIVKKITQSSRGAEISLGAIGRPWERGEYQDDYAQPILWLQSDVASVADHLKLVLEPVSLALGGREWTGFSYAFEFTSRSRQIHRLLTHATWEIGGRLTGNTVLSQGQCNRPVYRGAKETLFTTACLRTLAGHGLPQGYSFQIAPRAGLVQGFDFQFSRHGALLQFWPKFDSISSLVESPRGEDRLHVVDEYRFELAHRAVTTPKWVVFTAGKLAEHEARDLWWESIRHVYGGILPLFQRDAARCRVYFGELQPAQKTSLHYSDYIQYEYSECMRICPLFTLPSRNRFIARFPSISAS